MREFDALKDYPVTTEIRYVNKNIRTIENRIKASYRDKEFYDGHRNNGYGGLTYDGRWSSVAQLMIKEYNLKDNSSILQIGSDKGFLLHEFKKINKTFDINGIEVSDYAINNSLTSVKDFIFKGAFTKFNLSTSSFDLVIAIGPVYALNLPDAIKCLKEIQRVSKGNSFITLGAYDNENDLRLFKFWTLLGSTILSKSDWIKVLKHSGFEGDYKFNTAKTLNLEEKDEHN